MKTRTNARLFWLAIPLTLLALAGCAGTGLRDSDPHLTGARDMNYDHLIVPNQRIGPVRMGGGVSEAVKHLGNPDRVWRSTFRGPGYTSDEVTYRYDEECIRFTWTDSGIDPEIEKGYRGINVTCGKWSTPEGLHVGSSMQDVAAHFSRYCTTNRRDGSLLLMTMEGIWFEARDRYSPVDEISVVPAPQSLSDLGCKD